MEIPDPPWPDLVAGVRRGDGAAAHRLVEDLYPTVIKIVRAHLPKGEDEEDLAQDIFMKVFSKIEQFRAVQPFPHWVSRIAINTCYDRLRRRKIRKVLTFNELSIEESEFLDRSLGVPATASPSSTDGELVHELLDKLLSTLKPREQIVIQLLDLRELSVSEVCDITGWGASKVKVTAMRARQKLATTLSRLESASAIQVSHP